MSGPVAVELEELPAQNVADDSLSALCVEVTISFIIDPLGPGTPVRSVSAMSPASSRGSPWCRP